MSDRPSDVGQQPSNEVLSNTAKEAEQTEQITRVLFTDKHAVVELAQNKDEMAGTGVQPWEPGEPIGDPALLESLRAGCEAVAWFSKKAGVHDYGRELRNRVKSWLPEGRSLRFIVEVAPEDWNGKAPSFDDLWETAAPTLPRRTRKQKKPRELSSTTHGRASEASFDTSPAEIARRIIRRFGDRLLIVAPPQHDPKGYSTGYALAGNGLWLPGGDQWARWLRLIAEEMSRDAITSGLTDKALAYAISAINRVKNTSLVERVRQHLRAELDGLRARGTLCKDVTECAAEDLDAKLQFLGARNGVIDLHTGKLLTPEEGRRCLVTVSVPVVFDANAQHEAVDLLFAHLGNERATWWWQVLGRGLRGPTKRLYCAVGEPDGGKSTLLKALLLTLGPYACKAARGVLSSSNRASETQLSPGLIAWLSPVRFVLSEEEKRRQYLDAGLMKDLTGMGYLSARGMRENLRQAQVTATTIMFSNRDSVPRLSLETEGMQNRFRELPYPKVPKVDLRMSETTVSDPAFQVAFLARLVWWAACTPEPPADIPAVAEATKDRIREDTGELGAFAKRIVRGNKLTLDKVWTAWCEHVDEPPGSTEAGGIKRLRFSATLRDYVTDLPAAKLVSKDGRKVRGWRGWKLLTVKEVETTAVQAAEQVIQDLINAELVDGNTRVSALFGEFEKEALRHRYAFGYELEKALKETSAAGSKVEIEGEKVDRFTELSEEQRTAMLRYEAMELLMTTACLTYPMGPVGTEARERISKLDMVTYGRENVALIFLRIAEWELGRGGPCDVEAVVKRAIELKDDELRRNPSKTDYYASDIEDAMKELAGLPGAKSA
jgi:phage/plasmid-associated DNA primase